VSEFVSVSGTGFPTCLSTWCFRRIVVCPNKWRNVSEQILHVLFCVSNSKPEVEVIDLKSSYQVVFSINVSCLLDTMAIPVSEVADWASEQMLDTIADCLDTMLDTNVSEQILHVLNSTKCIS